MSLKRTLQMVERRLHMWPGVQADVIVILHETWKPADGETAQGVTFKRCDCHDWSEQVMIDQTVITEDSV